MKKYNNNKNDEKVRANHDKKPVLVDDLRLRDRRTVVINNPIQPDINRLRDQLTRYEDVALS